MEYPWQLTQDENNPVGHLNSIQSTVGTTSLVTWTSGDYDQRGNLTGWVTCLGGNPQGCPGFGAGGNLGYDLNEDLTVVAGDAGGATFSGQENLISYGYDTAGGATGDSLRVCRSKRLLGVFTATCGPQLMPRLQHIAYKILSPTHC